MTEELDDEKRTWYLKGYAQAEADQEVLIKKLMKDISDLSAERIGWINESGLFSPDHEELLKVTTERDSLNDLLSATLRDNDARDKLRRKKTILECVTIAWDAPEPDGWDVASRIAEGTGYKIVQDGERIRLENKE